MSKEWSCQDICILEQYTSVTSLAGMSKKLNRSKMAVTIKRNRLGIQSFRDSTEYLSSRQVCEMMGVTYRTVRRWARHGLKTRKIGPVYAIDQDEFVEFLRKNQDLWNAKKVKDDTLFVGKPWFKQKRKSDAKTAPYYWTPVEESKVRTLYEHGASNKQIADATGRSIKAVKYKIRYLKDIGKLKEQNIRRDAKCQPERKKMTCGNTKAG